MKRLLIMLSAILALASCRGGDGALQETLPPPVVKYELSGGAGHYNYAPSFIKDEYGIVYGFICENKNPFEIIDYVYLYKGIPDGKGGYTWQPGTQIVAPSKEGWDCIHICDPDVREFKTKWKGETYDYIMTYLGVDQWFDHNQIGLAVSKCIEGPYTKFDGNPLVPYEGRDKWGTGQSTSIVKNDSTIVIFYHSTTENGPYCSREIILNDLDNIRLGEERKVPHLTPNTYPAILGDRIYTVSEMRSESYDKNLIPTWVGDECRVAWAPIDADIYDKDNDPWIEVGRITPAMSGFPRNHNPGFLTDPKGYLPDDGKLVVYFTPAVTGEDWLWSYDLYSATYTLNK